MRGIEENGALATAKHFPGHGNVNVDSHLSLATVPGSRENLENTELIPFRAAIQAGVSAIMPGHLAVPAFEPESEYSRNAFAQYSYRACCATKLKFRGLIVTDALDMGGVTSIAAPGEAAVRAVEAGADVLLMPPVPDAAIASLENAVRSGRISENRIDASVRRILAAKARLRPQQKSLVDVAQLSREFRAPRIRKPRARNRRSRCHSASRCPAPPAARLDAAAARAARGALGRSRSLSRRNDRAGNSSAGRFAHRASRRYAILPRQRASIAAAG